MCARVCPTETLCEEACVREAAEGKPVEIGRLQRYATDTLMMGGRASLHARAPPASASRWSAPGLRGWPARTGWR
jgi:dihydropyrimidine dehydrogenase (NAD+) subunit PreT